MIFAASWARALEIMEGLYFYSFIAVGIRRWKNFFANSKL